MQIKPTADIEIERVVHAISLQLLVAQERHADETSRTFAIDDILAAVVTTCRIITEAEMLGQGQIYRIITAVQTLETSLIDADNNLITTLTYELEN